MPTKEGPIRHRARVPGTNPATAPGATQKKSAEPNSGAKTPRAYPALVIASSNGLSASRASSRCATRSHATRSLSSDISARYRPLCVNFPLTVRSLRNTLSSLAQGRRDRQLGCAHGGQQAADEPHQRREADAKGQDPRRDAEG